MTIKIRELGVQDTDDLAAFFSTQTDTSEHIVRNRLKWLARNPAATTDIPFGVGAYRSSELCGAMLWVPMHFTNGVDIRTCVLSILFYVDVSARGVGIPLFLAYRKLADRYPLYAATANALTAP